MNTDFHELLQDIEKQLDDVRKKLSKLRESTKVGGQQTVSEQDIMLVVDEDFTTMTTAIKKKDDKTQEDYGSVDSSPSSQTTINYDSFQQYVKHTIDNMLI